MNAAVYHCHSNLEVFSTYALLNILVKLVKLTCYKASLVKLCILSMSLANTTQIVKAELL